MTYIVLGGTLNLTQPFGLTLVLAIWGSVYVSGIVTSHVNGLPLDRGSRVVPSGVLYCHRQVDRLCRCWYFVHLFTDITLNCDTVGDRAFPVAAVRLWNMLPSRSGVVISITNCYIRFTLLYFTLPSAMTSLPSLEMELFLISYVNAH